MTDIPNALPAPAPSRPQAVPTTAAARRTDAPAEPEFSFWDLLDVVNPLQHIPLLGHFYRQITGDEIRAPARILGGTLFGGPLGMAASVVGAIVEEASGKSPVGHVVAWFSGDREPAGPAPSKRAAPPSPVVAVAQTALPSGPPPGAPVPLPRELVAEAMLGALDKYRRAASLSHRP